MIVNFIPAMGKEEMEMQLWSYIDKTCSDAEAQRIAALVAGNKQWQAAHQQLLALHRTLTVIEPGQPSMRFSKNVMEAISVAQPVPASKSYVNPWVLRGVMAVFVLLIAVIFIYTLPLINWSSAARPAMPFHFDLSKLDIGKWWMAIAGVNIVLLIIFLDAFFRFKTKHAR